MRDKFAGFVAGIAFVLVITWIVAMVIRYTESWINWWAVVDALPFAVMGLVISVILIGMFTRKKGE